jgi:hypothetical protein
VKSWPSSSFSRRMSSNVFFWSKNTFK